VFFLISLVLAVFVVPEPWKVPTVVIGLAVEIAETAFTLWLSRRGKPKVGAETLIGTDGRVTRRCDPLGEVRVRAETWQARCDTGADVGDEVRVVGREGLTLIVEPAGDVAA
jgi:membrane-bound serine protease (ClpP class)